MLVPVWSLLSLLLPLPALPAQLLLRPVLALRLALALPWSVPCLLPCHLALCLPSQVHSVQRLCVAAPRSPSKWFQERLRGRNLSPGGGPMECAMSLEAPRG